MKKRLLQLISALFSAVAFCLMNSCAPLAYTFDVDLRQPSTSGYDFSGKTMAMVYVYSNQADSLYSSIVAEGFAQQIEKDYFNSESTLPLYTMKFTEGGQYISKDTLVNLIVDLNADVVFLLDKPGDESVRIGAMDAMDKSEKLASYEFALQTPGTEMAGFFTPKWVKEEHAVYMCSGSKWVQAGDCIAEFQLDEATDKLLEIVDRGSADKRAAAAYDLAFCAYLQHKYELAIEWLNFADSCYSLPRTSWLRRHCNDRMKIRGSRNQE